MKYLMPFLFFVIVYTVSLKANPGSPAKIPIDKLSEQLLKIDGIIGKKFPEYTDHGSWKFREKVNWLSGFLSGELWNMYYISGNKEFKERALAQADNLIQYCSIDYTHDMGFIFLPSCVKAYKETGDKKYLDAALKAAEMLAKRFNKNGNFIRAWGALSDPNQAGWIIIDTMMNIELLFWAAEQTGNTEYYDIAYRHAITTMQQIVRENFSSYHVVEFDPATGKVIKKRTHQGYADESTWARGQAWGIYGFANAYKYTGDERFLVTAAKMADYFLERLPKDLVPVWDLDLQEQDFQDLQDKRQDMKDMEQDKREVKERVRDASAAAIAASGMFILSEVSKSGDNSRRYADYAARIASSLTDNYLFTASRRSKEDGILMHTVYHYHKKWGVDESFPAGDYYYMEALEKMNEYNCKKYFIKDEEKRQEILMNDEWYYLEDNAKELADVRKSAKEWQKISLPHTWNNFDAVDNAAGYRRDGSWYQKYVFIPQVNNSLDFVLHFEGVNITSEVYVNGNLAGGHEGGYIGFDVDITPFIKKGEMNEILVRVDNSVNPDVIPSQKSDFFIYGGINRDVWMKVLPEDHINTIKISSPSVSEKKASTKVEVNIVSVIDKQIETKVIVKDASGKVVSSVSEKKNLCKGNNNVSVKLPEIKNPILWSNDNPYLYSVTAEIITGNKLIDQVTDKFGYRWFEFKPHGQFYLNGKKLKLRGTQWHEDYAGMGNAFPDSLKTKDFKMIKSMGANFVRLAHYPQDPSVYKACDELGIIVWDELPWCRGGMGGNTWKANTTRMLNEMIDQNYNHASIVFWSLGNELYWVPDFPGGDNNDSLRAFLRELNDIAHRKDPARLTAARKYYEGSDLVDVFSPSIWAGWYSGVYKNYQAAIEDAQKKYPRMLHMEYGGDSHVGRHNESPINGDGILSTKEWEESPNQVKIANIANTGDWSESYIVDLFDWHLRYTETSDTFPGSAQWIFKDFGTPLRPENPIPYINQKGLTDRAGNPKDAFYVFKSYWNKSDLFCYIESHTWKERSGPENTLREVNVFSNCDAVELFLNGQSLGVKEKDLNKFPASGLSWQLKFNEGNNSLKAIGYLNKVQKAIDTLEVKYTFKKPGTPDRISLSAERLKNGNYLITAYMVDKDGRHCLDYNKRIYFSVSGSGKLMENYGTPKGSSVIEAANGKAQIELKTFGFDKVTVEARNQDFKGDYVRIR